MTRAQRDASSNAIASHAISVEIRQTQGEHQLNAVQKKFNQLSAQVAKKKQLLAQWHESIEAGRMLFLEQLLPLRKEYLEGKKSITQLFEWHLNNSRFGRVQRAKLVALTTDLAASLYAETEDEQWKQLHDRYSESNYDDICAALDAESEAMARALFSRRFGVDIPEDMAFAGPEDMAAYVERQLNGDGDNEDEGGGDAEFEPEERPKPASRQEQHERAAQASLQSVYRQLITLIHPDRARNDSERAEKTELMKRVTVAYEQGDLLQLLELQLKLQPATQSAINEFGKERVAQLNAVLKAQLRDLDGEIDQLAFASCEQFDLQPSRRPRPSQIQRALHDQITQCERALRSIKTDLKMYQDVKVLKALLSQI